MAYSHKKRNYPKYVNKFGKLYYDGILSNLRFLNIYASNEATEDQKFKQLIKFREEFYECMVEPFESRNFKIELLDCIQAATNLFHALEGDNMELMDKHVEYMNRKAKENKWFDVKEWKMYEE